MRALHAALTAIDEVAAEGDLVPDPLTAERLDLEAAGEPILLPDGKRIHSRRCTASPSTGSPARCWTCRIPPARRSCG